MKGKIKNNRWPFGLLLSVGGASLAAWCEVTLPNSNQWWGLGVFLMTAACMYIVIQYITGKIIERLAARAEADQPDDGDQSAYLTVWVNDVSVGTISDSTYARMQLMAFNNKRLSVAQVIEAGRFLFRCISSAFYAIPAFAFWFVGALAIFDPESLISIAHAFQNSSDTEVRANLKTITQAVVVFVTIIAAQALLMSGYRFNNPCGNAIAGMLRRHLNIAATGDIRLTSNATGACTEGVGLFHPALR